LISFQDILEISDSVDISGYLRISQDIPGYLFGANSQMAAQDVSGSELVIVLRTCISFAKAYQKGGEYGTISGNKRNIILLHSSWNLDICNKATLKPLLGI
jgi:hypothetical protein